MKERPLGLMRSPALSAARGALKGSKILTTRLVAELPATSSAGGTYYVAIPVHSTLVSLGEFTDFTNLFDQYRFKRVRVTYIPLTPYKAEALTNTNGRVLCSTYDPNDASTPSSTLGMWASAEAHVWSNFDTKVLSWTNKTDPVWYSTLSTTNPLTPSSSVKISADANLGANIPFGVFYFEWYVEFRSRR
jgi:hypothetical protein